MSDIRIEDWKAQIDGTMTAIVLACTAMIASHPEKKKILALLKNLASMHSLEDANDDSPTKHYKLGIREAVSTVAFGVENAVR